MNKPAKDPIREKRIHNEVIVDAYGPEEQAMGWYYYLDGKMRFPFQARCVVTRVVSRLRKGETFEVRRMAREEACSSDMLVLIRWQGRNMAVPLSQLAAVDPDEVTAEAITGIIGWPKATCSESTRENVIAGTDCGLGAGVGHPKIVWAKFEAIAEGARLATASLWKR